jgi:hypothetical protein
MPTIGELLLTIRTTGANSAIGELRGIQIEATKTASIVDKELGKKKKTTVDTTAEMAAKNHANYLRSEIRMQEQSVKNAQKAADKKFSIEQKNIARIEAEREKIELKRIKEADKKFEGEQKVGNVSGPSKLDEVATNTRQSVNLRGMRLAFEGVTIGADIAKGFADGINSGDIGGSINKQFRNLPLIGSAYRSIEGAEASIFNMAAKVIPGNQGSPIGRFFSRARTGMNEEAAPESLDRQLQLSNELTTLSRGRNEGDISAAGIAFNEQKKVIQMHIDANDVDRKSLDEELKTAGKIYALRVESARLHVKDIDSSTDLVARQISGEDSSLQTRINSMRRNALINMRNKGTDEREAIARKEAADELLANAQGQHLKGGVDFFRTAFGAANTSGTDKSLAVQQQIHAVAQQILTIFQHTPPGEAAAFQ